MKENNSLTFKVLMLGNILKGKNPNEDFDCDYTQYTSEQLHFLLDYDVNKCQIILYQELVKWLGEDLTYEEIVERLENFDYEDYVRLASDQQQFIKEDIKNILVRRMQMKGNDKNE